MKRLLFLLALLCAATPADAYYKSVGTVLSLSATCTTAYQGGTAVAATRDETRLTLVVTVTKAASASSMSSAEFTVQIYDGSNWHDVGSVRNNSTLDTKTEHSVTAPSAGQSTRIVLQTESFAPAVSWRIEGKVTGGSCVSGDILSAKAYVQ